MTTLTEQAAKAAAKAQELAQLAAAEQAEQEQTRQARLEAHDRQFVANWQHESQRIEQEQTAAREQFEQALRDDPVFGAWTAFRAARWRSTYLRSSVAAAMDRLGSTDPRPAELAFRDPRLLEDLLELCEGTARDIAADEEQARTAARDTAGDGA